MIIIGCGCKKNRLPKLKHKPISTEQKRKVLVHIWKEEQRSTIGFFTKPLDEEKIIYEIKLDRKPANRPYPYLTVEGQLLCTKKVINAKKRGDL